MQSNGIITNKTRINPFMFIINLAIIKIDSEWKPHCAFHHIHLKHHLNGV